MADNLKDIKDRLTCPVCLELFNDPYVLPCMHVLCRSCIGDIVRNQSSFSCPECRRNIVLDKAGINGLERDRRTALMVEAADRAMKRQTVKNKSKVEKCEKHGKPEDVYCKSCNILLCSKCAFGGNHEGHPIFEAEEAADKGKQWINVMLEQVEDYHDKTVEKINDCETQTQAIKADASRLWNLMEKTFEKIKSDLLKREEELNRWLQKQIEECENVNRTYILSLKNNASSLNKFMQQLKEKLKEGSVPFVKSFGVTKKRILDTLEIEKNRKNPESYPGDALSSIEFKYAPWRIIWPGNIEDITLEGSIKRVKEHSESFQPRVAMQETTLAVNDLHRRLLANSKSARDALEKSLKKVHATVEWPLDFKKNIKVISQVKEQRKHFNQEIQSTVSKFLSYFRVQHLDFKDLGFKWVQWRVEHVEKEMKAKGDNFALLWTASDVTVIGIEAKMDQLILKLKTLMQEKKVNK